MTFDVRADQTSQLQLSNIHGADDLELRRTIEPRYSTPEAREFLQRHTMAISIKNADVDQIKAVKMVIKVLYVRPGSSNVSAIADSDVGAGTNPAEVAAGHGTVIGVVRMSRIDPISTESLSE